MKKKRRLMLRTLCAILALCLGAAVALPMAYATTPEREAVLATGQRSRNNPDGIFTAPAAVTSLRLFHPETRQATRLIASNIIEQLISGHSDPDAVRRIMAYAPIVTDGELPPLDMGDDLLQYLLHMLQIGARNVYIALRETDRPDVYQIITLFSTQAGEVFWVPQGIEYDAATGWIYGTDNDGILGIGFDYNVSQYMVRSASDAWQRPIGYNRLFDIATPLVLTFLDTLRFPFVYQGRDWMIQIWKGYYGPSNGAEIGIYEKDTGHAFFWDASDTMLDISMQLYQEDTLFFDYGTQRTWWTGGFRYGNYLLTPLLPARQLRLTGTINFEDPGMRDAFWASFEANKNDLITGTMDGMIFSFDWQTG